MSQSRRGGGGGIGRKKSSSHEAGEGAEAGARDSRTQDGEEERVGSSRARRVFDSLDQDTIDRKVGEIVRYLLCAQRRKAPVKKSELVDKAVGSDFSSCFSCFIPLARQRLSEVFGVALDEMVPKTKSGKQTTIRYYILTNQIAVPAREALLPCSQREREERGLLIVILALIMLKDGSIQEESLFNVLRHLNISNSSFHTRFGDTESLVRKDFVEAKFLDREKAVVGDQNRFVYHWGLRAEVAVDKRQLLALVAELHGNDIARWEKQFGHMMLEQN